MIKPIIYKLNEQKYFDMETDMDIEMDARCIVET